MKIIYKSEKNKIIEKLSYYGIENVPYLLIRFGSEKIRGYSGGLSIDEIGKLDQQVGIELMGLYLFHEYDKEIRLSIEAIHALNRQIIKNILELNDEQAEKWFEGKDIPIIEEWKNEQRGFKILKHGKDFIGCGKLTEDRIANYMPKERRIKGKNK